MYICSTKSTNKVCQGYMLLVYLVYHTQTINIWSSIIMYYVNWVSSYVGGKNVENFKKIFEHKNIIQYLG
jgi:hypothetical protein